MNSKALLICIFIPLAGCGLIPKPSPAELAQLDAPPAELQPKLKILSEKAEVWLKDTNREYAGTGRSLSADEMRYAKQIGVKNPENVKIIIAETFPVPKDPELKQATEDFGMSGYLEGGRTMDHIIFLKPSYTNSTTVISHELNHVAQFDRFGTSRMVKRYISELLILGYLKSPLEREAYEKQVDTWPAN